MRRFKKLTSFITALAMGLLLIAHQVAGASAICDTYEVKILDAFLNQTNWTSDTAIYLALYTAAPSDATGGTEVSGGSYARADITSKFSAASGTSGVLATNATTTFTTASASWGTVTHFTVMAASSGGSCLLWGAVTTSKTVGSGDTAEVATGDLSVTIAHFQKYVEWLASRNIPVEQKIAMYTSTKHAMFDDYSLAMATK